MHMHVSMIQVVRKDTHWGMNFVKIVMIGNASFYVLCALSVQHYHLGMPHPHW